MALKAPTWPCRVLTLSIFFIVSFLCFWTGRLQFGSGQERRRLAASIVREQIGFLTQWQPDIKLLSRESGWPDDFLLLGNWLVVQLASSSEPKTILRQLIALSRDRSYSRTLRNSINRWSDALGRWSELKKSVFKFDPTYILQEARILHFEAMGLQKIGRQYDGVALYTQTILLLAKFIEKNANDSYIPEALFLLGDSMIRLRHVLPSSIRSDRILNLCSELYPESIWGQQANLVWRSESLNGG